MKEILSKNKPRLNRLLRNKVIPYRDESAWLPQSSVTIKKNVEDRGMRLGLLVTVEIKDSVLKKGRVKGSIGGVALRKGQLSTRWARMVEERAEKIGKAGNGPKEARRIQAKFWSRLINFEMNVIAEYNRRRFDGKIGRNAFLVDALITRSAEPDEKWAKVVRKGKESFVLFLPASLEINAKRTIEGPGGKRYKITYLRHMIPLRCGTRRVKDSDKEEALLATNLKETVEGPEGQRGSQEECEASGLGSSKARRIIDLDADGNFIFMS